MEKSVQESFRPKIEARIAELDRNMVATDRLEFQLDATICVSCFRRARK